jgi:hypothetical protein
LPSPNASPEVQVQVDIATHYSPLKESAPKNKAKGLTPADWSQQLNEQYGETVSNFRQNRANSFDSSITAPEQFSTPERKANNLKRQLLTDSPQSKEFSQRENQEIEKNKIIVNDSQAKLLNAMKNALTEKQAKKPSCCQKVKMPFKVGANYLKAVFDHSPPILHSEYGPISCHQWFKNAFKIAVRGGLYYFALDSAFKYAFWIFFHNAKLPIEFKPSLVPLNSPGSTPFNNGTVAATCMPVDTGYFSSELLDVFGKAPAACFALLRVLIDTLQVHFRQRALEQAKLEIRHFKNCLFSEETLLADLHFFQKHDSKRSYDTGFENWFENQKKIMPFRVRAAAWAGFYGNLDIEENYTATEKNIEQRIKSAKGRYWCIDTLDVFSRIFATACVAVISMAVLLLKELLDMLFETDQPDWQGLSYLTSVPLIYLSVKIFVATVKYIFSPVFMNDVKKKCSSLEKELTAVKEEGFTDAKRVLVSPIGKRLAAVFRLQGQWDVDELEDRKRVEWSIAKNSEGPAPANKNIKDRTLARFYCFAVKQYNAMHSSNDQRRRTASFFTGMPLVNNSPTQTNFAEIKNH